MLKRLRVRNLAIVEEVEAAFSSALTVITGETGAGKSVLMGALDLVLGGRADPDIVRDGAGEGEVEAEFDDVVIRRTLTREGRSRAWINDESVTIGELRELGRRRVDIHGPRANQNILAEGFQRESLDSFAGITGSGLMRGYAEAWGEFRRITDEIDALASGVDAESEMDMLRFQTGELAAAEVTEADADIAERHAAAAHAEEIAEGANSITELLGGDESAAGMLAAVVPLCTRLSKHLAEASEWAEEAERLSSGVRELSRSVADAVSRVDVNPEEFAALDARLGLIRRLQKKYGEDLAGALERKRARLEELENLGTVRERLDRELEKARRLVAAKAAELTTARKAGAKKLSKAVTGALVDLGFLQAKFSVAIESAGPEAHGADRVVYMFEPNPGESARPLAQIASSGEIARVMLALKSVLAGHDTTGTLVFDEIDANIGGEVGRIVGRRMRSLAADHQVIAITHLPQSAVYGDRHLVVSKSVSGGRTRTGIAEVRGRERVSEIARMLGGEKLTSVIGKHAEELLKNAEEE